jgi:hypothetical protein
MPRYVFDVEGEEASAAPALELADEGAMRAQAVRIFGEMLVHESEEFVAAPARSLSVRGPDERVVLRLRLDMSPPPRPA